MKDIKYLSRLQDNPLIQTDERKCRFYALLRVAACQKIDPSTHLARKRRERGKVSVSGMQTRIHGCNKNAHVTAVPGSTLLLEISAKTYIDKYVINFYKCDDKESIF